MAQYQLASIRISGPAMRRVAGKSLSACHNSFLTSELPLHPGVLLRVFADPSKGTRAALRRGPVSFGLQDERRGRVCRRAPGAVGCAERKRPGSVKARRRGDGLQT
jgi:hypothetical protein